MANLVQLLLEMLKTSVLDRNNESRPVQGELPDDMTGFILGNVHVAPFIEYEDEDAQEPNPLLQLVHNRELPQRGSIPISMKKILDHIFLELSIPACKCQQRVWLATARISEADPSDEDSDDYPEDNAEDLDYRGSLKSSGFRNGTHNSKSKPFRPSSPPRKKLSRVKTQQIRLEKEEKNIFARLLFSRCWTGKEQAGWKIKRKCPPEEKLSLSCPCGQIGPCRKVKKNPCPIDQMTSKKKNTKSPACSSGSKFFQNKISLKNHKKKPITQSKDLKANGKPLFEKLFPCCFKDHMHGECCCRCKDNPPLHHNSNSKGVLKNSPKVASPKPSPSESGKATPLGDHSASSSEGSEDEGGDGSLHREPEYRTFNMETISRTSQNKYEGVKKSRKQAKGERFVASKHKASASRRSKKEAHRLETNDSNPIKPITSTTSFQVIYPDTSYDQIVEPEVVSHQILKTVSTVHGPVRVEQKIMVQGTENSVVTVTHGEACQCNLCQMLKSMSHPTELVEGLSQQIVRISTGNGRNTLIKHNDGCGCELCRVLELDVTQEGEHMEPSIDNDNSVLAEGSSSDENGSGEILTLDAVKALHSNITQSTPIALDPEFENSRHKAYRTLSLIRKLKRKSRYKKKKAKKCKCTKCCQKRRVEKLILRLKKEVGAEEYDEILREIARFNNNDHSNETKIAFPTTPKQRKPSIDSYQNDGYVEPNRKNKSVSFSDELPKHWSRFERPDTYGSFPTEKWKCKLCEVVGLYDKPVLKKKKDPLVSWSSKAHNTTVYNMNESSQESPSEYHSYGSRIPKENINNQLLSESKLSFEREHPLDLEEQKCFPLGHIPKLKKQFPTKKSLEGMTVQELKSIDKDTNTSHLQNESQYNGRWKQKGSRENMNPQQKEPSAILLSNGAFPQNFVYWSPESHSSAATVCRSDSYYVPDYDEFPIVNAECEASDPTS